MVELMVVVVIIGILVAIAVPVYNSVTDTAQENACIANQRIIEGALVQWQMAQDPPSTGVPANGLTDLAGYFQETPTCPTSGTYTVTANGTTCSDANH